MEGGRQVVIGDRKEGIMDVNELVRLAHTGMHNQKRKSVQKINRLFLQVGIAACLSFPI